MASYEHIGIAQSGMIGSIDGNFRYRSRRQGLRVHGQRRTAKLCVAHEPRVMRVRVRIE